MMSFPIWFFVLLCYRKTLSNARATEKVPKIFKFLQILYGFFRRIMYNTYARNINTGGTDYEIWFWH